MISLRHLLRRSGRRPALVPLAAVVGRGRGEIALRVDPSESRAPIPQARSTTAPVAHPAPNRTDVLKAVDRPRRVLIGRSR